MCVGAVLIWGSGTALGQWNFGVGRDIDPGRLRSVGRLQSIGGFQRITANPALEAASRGGMRPQAPVSIGTPTEPLRRAGSRAFAPTMQTFYGASTASMRQTASARFGNVGVDTGRFARLYQDTRIEAQQDRGLSVVGRRFAGANYAYEPMVSQRGNAARPVPYSGIDWMGRGGVHGGARMYRSILGGGAVAGAAATRWQQSFFRPKNPIKWREAEVAVRNSPLWDRGPETQPAMATVSIDQVISARLEARRAAYLQRGWAQFQARRYSDAYNSFALADRVRPNTPEAKMGIALAAIATSRYTAAASAWASLLRHCTDDQVRALLDAASGIRARYGSEADYTAHYQAFNDYLRGGTTMNLAALQALVQWGRGDRAGARFLARKLAEGATAGSPVSRLANLMEPQAPAGPSGSSG